LIPPDVIEGVESFCDEDYARNVLRAGFDDPRKTRRQRLFLDGYLYKNIFDTGYLVIDGECDLNVTIADGSSTVFRVRDAIDEAVLLESLIQLCESMPTTGTVRKGMGDRGEMYALGYRNIREGLLYVPTRIPEIGLALRRSGPLARDYMQRTVFQECLEKIKTAEDSLLAGSEPPYCSSLVGTPSLSVMVSKNLGNASHYDWDGSPCCVIFLEARPGTSTNWRFILPSVMVGDHRGVVVEMKHGRVLEFDGRSLRHCSSITERGDGNHVYGVWYGCCNT
jgi:hypothetical protein